MRETLGSIPDPNYHSDNEIGGSLKRVGIAGLADWSDAKWSMLAEESAKKIGAPELIRDSVIQYRLHHRQSMKRVHQREAVAALLFVFSKKYLKNHMSLKSLCETVGANRVKTGRYLTRFILEDGLKSNYKSPEDYVRAYGSRLSIDRNVVVMSVEIARHYHESSIAGVTPRTVAASALYLACKENGHPYTQREIAETFGIAEYTVRENCGRMKRCLEAIESPR